MRSGELQQYCSGHSQRWNHAGVRVGFTLYRCIYGDLPLILPCLGPLVGNTLQGDYIEQIMRPSGTCEYRKSGNLLVC